VTPGERLLARLQRRTRDLSPELGAEIMKAGKKLVAGLSIDEVADIIASGNYERLFTEILNEALFNQAFADLQKMYFRQTMDNLDFFAKDYGISFGVLDPRVIEEIRRLDIKMATILKDDVREAVRRAVEVGLRNGVNPRTIAVGVRQNLMLTGPQTVWIDNFRRELEANSRKALQRSLGQGFFKKPDGSLGYRAGHAGGLGVSKRDMTMLDRVLGSDERLRPDQIDRLVEAYRKRMTAWHAESVARTATLDSLKNAQHLSTEQAIRDGILPADRMMSEWVSVGDSRVRDEHVAMDRSDPIPFGSMFTLPDGTQELIPGESTYGCRCAKRDFLGPRGQ